MASFVQQIPAWVKVVLAIGGILVSVTLAYAALQREDTRINGQVELLKAQDAALKEDVKDIKDMLRELIFLHQSNGPNEASKRPR